MGRFGIAMLLATCIATSSEVAIAGTPDQAMSLIPDQLTLSCGPQFPNNPIGTNEIVIKDAAGLPVQGARVRITFADAVGMISLCAGNNVLLTTDAAGTATFHLFGGGCIHPDPGPWSLSQSCASNPGVVAPAYVEVYYPSSVLVFTVYVYHISSPDAVNSSGFPPRCDPRDNSCDLVAGTEIAQAGLSDAVFHTAMVKSGLLERCSKFTAPFDGPVGLSDATFLTPYIRAGSRCTCN